MSSHFQSSHYGSSHFESSHFGRVAVVPPPEPDDGSAWRPEDPWQRERPDFYREQILQEDEEILAIIQAFLHVMDD